MKKTITTAIVLLTGISLFTACDKEKREIRNDKSTPVVTVNTPANLQSFKSGDTIKITGSAEDNSMHEMTIELKDDSTDSVYFNETPFVHDLSSYQINTFWKSMVSRVTNATLTVTVEDHANHVGTASVKIQIKP